MKKMLRAVLVIVCLLAVTGFVGGTDQADGSFRREASAEKVLRVGTAPDSPPFAYYQEASKTHIGFDMELMRGLGREMGYDRVEFVHADFHDLLPSLQEGKVDAVISCMTITEERRKAADFTKPYLEGVKSAAVASSDMDFDSVDALKDKRIAVAVDSVHAKQAKRYSDDVIVCDSAEEALKMVLEKKADVALMDNYVARFYMTYFYRGRLTLMAELPGDTEGDLGIAVAKGNKEMLDKLDAALQNYRATAAYNQMKRSYFGRLEV